MTQRRRFPRWKKFLSSVLVSTCAWVLWERTDLHLFEKQKNNKFRMIPQTTEWKILAGFEKYSDCFPRIEEASSNSAKKFKNSPGVEKIHQRTGGVYIYFKDTGGSASIEYICLPGTLDPRPRK